MDYTYVAHINEDTKEIQTVKEHSENTAVLCRDFSIERLKDIMFTLGITHDIGKFQGDFQRKITGANLSVEHSGCGALVVHAKYQEPVRLLMEYCIVGHHSGIPDGGSRCDGADMSTLSGRLKRKFKDFSEYKEELVLPQIHNDEFMRFLAQDCNGNVELLIDKFAFLTRYCFSCLTDADSIDTARFCSGEKIRPMTADFEACLEQVNKKLISFVCKTRLQTTRALLQEQVFKKSKTDAEIYLMNMPTGSGKTLCSVKFALERALYTGKKRIIYVIPYNSIIDQIMSVLENLFGDNAEILRHQSTFSYEDQNIYSEDYRKVAKSASENWDVSSIIVTTAVQFFESIYANKRGKLRKMHNMADSILIFDEAHLMPQDYLQPCLRGIAYITRYLNSEAVFLTATMPDYSELLHRYALKNSNVIHLVEDRSMFSSFQKCTYQYAGKKNMEEIVKQTTSSPTSLIIMNKKRTARAVYRECGGKKYHLSTYMVGIDRKNTLDEIRIELDKLEKDYPDNCNIPENRRITIISTSLIEAGVDLDVYTVFREMTGLDSILQAGGRCNREGKREKASVYIFDLEEDKKDAQDIKTNITKGIIDKYEDISCPQSIVEYYGRLLNMNDQEIQKNTITNRSCDLSSIEFKTYAESFELIDSETFAVVVPRDTESQQIVDSLRYSGGGVNIGRKLQKYTCSIRKWELDDLLKQHVVDDFGTGIYCLTNPDYYDNKLGILFESKDYFIE